MRRIDAGAAYLRDDQKRAFERLGPYALILNREPRYDCGTAMVSVRRRMPSPNWFRDFLSAHAAHPDFSSKLQIPLVPAMGKTENGETLAVSLIP